MSDPQLNLNYETQLVTVVDSEPTISAIWDDRVQQAVIANNSGPTIASRAYGILHTAIYDAWSAYVDTPISTNLEDDLQRPDAENTDANKSQAMSYAAYYVLVDLFPEQQTMFDRQMAELGYDVATISTDVSNPAGIGYLMARAKLDERRQDGSNQTNNYSDYTGYQPANQPGDIESIERWTPDVVPLGNGEFRTQEFLTPQWGNVTPFALESGSQFRPTAPQPFLLVDGAVDLDAKTITLTDGRVLEISRDLIGTIINPEFIKQTETVVKYSKGLKDKDKLIAEFWEDGAGTSYPPGTFMTFGQYVSARDNHSLDDDARLFFALGNAELDAGIAAWDAKVAYDYARPVSVVRELGELGLIGKYSDELGDYAIEAFSGYGEGTEKILASDFVTYQTPESDFSPPFAEYVSGHSTFSTAGAEVLRQFTGSDKFGASVTFPAGTSRFEPGLTPDKDITLSWKTFSDAADESGISRLYGGIHFEEGDLNGRALGREVGRAVYTKAQFYINGGDSSDSSYDEDKQNSDGADNLSGSKEDDRLEGDKGNDTLFGAEGDDTLDGGKDDDYLDGGIGNDSICGDKGNDTLFGGEGDDYLCGGKDDDYLDGGAGIDELVGDKGKDTFVLRIGEGADRILDFDDGSDRLGLADGLTFEELSLVGNNVQLGDTVLVTLTEIETASLTAEDFTTV